MLIVLQLDTLEGNILEVLNLLRSTRNMLAPISGIHPELLACIPDFWRRDDRSQDVIALTHVCQIWREIFTSRSSLWTYFVCKDPNKTRVYLEWSKSSPIHVFLRKRNDLPFDDPSFELVSDAIGRLGSMIIDVPPEDFQGITDRLSRRAPLLESLEILINPGFWALPPAVIPPLPFDCDFSSLRDLHLRSICTDLPWRNMTSLVSFQLGRSSTSLTNLIDFLEGAPHLLEVTLYSTTLTGGAQIRRPVPLPRLKRFSLHDLKSPSALFDHLVIPVGVDLRMDSVLLQVKDYLPGTLENLGNLSKFNEICLRLSPYCTCIIQFTGPNGRANFKLQIPRASAAHITMRILGSLDVSKTGLLKLICSKPLCGDVLYDHLLRMSNLHTLTIFASHNLSSFLRILDPDRNPSNVLVCPKLENLISYIHRESNAQTMINMAAARMSRGSRLKSVRIISKVKLAPKMVLELRKHVFHLEYDSVVGFVNDGDVSDEED